jgi:hypothetical protein
VSSQVQGESLGLGLRLRLPRRVLFYRDGTLHRLKELILDRREWEVGVTDDSPPLEVKVLVRFITHFFPGRVNEVDDESKQCIHQRTDAGDLRGEGVVARERQLQALKMRLCRNVFHVGQGGQEVRASEAEGLAVLTNRTRGQLAAGV